MGTATGGGGPRPFLWYIFLMATLNHIGIAVQDLAAMRKLFSLLGLNVDHSENVPEQGVMTHFIPLPLVQGQLELLDPVKEDSAVAQFLKKRGPGIHHLSFMVEKGKLESLSESLRSAGYRMIYDQPRAGAHGMRINFIHPATAGGMLIEVMEPA